MRNVTEKVAINWLKHDLPPTFQMSSLKHKCKLSSTCHSEDNMLMKILFSLFLVSGFSWKQHSNISSVQSLYTCSYLASQTYKQTLWLSWQLRYVILWRWGSRLCFSLATCLITCRKGILWPQLGLKYRRASTKGSVMKLEAFKGVNWLKCTGRWCSYT